METKQWTNKDKSAWGLGPWQDEPDKVQWTDPDTGLPCLAVRNHGAWCGYVGVSEGHPFFERAYQDIDVDVHGNLTFSEHCQETGDESIGVCHAPSPGEAVNVWWLGFDCNHTFDYDPEKEARMLELDPQSPFRGDPRGYKDLAYVRGEVRRLAGQLKAVIA